MARSESAGFEQLSRIPDLTLRNLLMLVLQRLERLEGGLEKSTRIRGDLDMEEGRVMNLPAAPSAPGDAISKSYADSTYGPEAIRAALEAGGSAPLRVSALTGRTGQVQAARLRVIPAGDPLPPVATAQDYELIRFFTGGAWALYFFDPSTPPGNWVAVV